MGAGKSTVGAVVAARLGVCLVDLDREIGDIPAIFAAEGEAGFRARERAVLSRCVAGSGVLALGGGTLVAPANRALMDGWRTVVLLARPEVLRSRIGDDPGRPLAAEMERILDERAAIWPLLGPIIDTSDIGPEAAADGVLAC